MTRNMGDSGDELTLDTDRLTKENTGGNSTLEVSDIVKLFTGVIQSQFKTFSGQLKAEQSESISKKLKENSLHKIKSEGWKTVNEYQCNEIADNSDDEKKIRSAENRALRHQKQNKRFQPYGTQKTPAAAGSPAQLAFPGASNTFQPFPAFQQQQQQPFLYGQGRNKQSRRQPMPYDVCFNCFATGHWKSNCPKGKATQSQ
ncbi:uncharacterized protein LOC125656897 [Ostrea edulis]|uniref:uncharacterized protein LOC125656897 n=1 Tax=Ostrea edulis TaxID=37623 RepID=UPI0024AE9533|nr:uncharacterized protein LOC125656897 [Ostrea edulis]